MENALLVIVYKQVGGVMDHRWISQTEWLRWSVGAKADFLALSHSSHGQSLLPHCPSRYVHGGASKTPAVSSCQSHISHSSTSTQASLSPVTTHCARSGLHRTLQQHIPPVVTRKILPFWPCRLTIHLSVHVHLFGTFLAHTTPVMEVGTMGETTRGPNALIIARG